MLMSMKDGIDQEAIRAVEKSYAEPRVRVRLLANAQVKVFRSRDYRAIRELALHPRILPQICDDFTCDPAKWQPIESEQVIYLLATDDEGPFGFGIFIPDTWACWKAHTAFLPRSYGADARKSFERMIQWMWANTQARRLVGEIVRENLLAIRFARASGFSIYGINRKSYLRGGVLRDQVCLGISKPE
jgi:hypothetical protein